MRVTIEKDNGEKEVFTEVTDLYIAYRREEIIAPTKAKPMHIVTTIRSHSWGSNVRDIVKEVQQSLFELRDHLFKELTRGRSG